MIPSPIIVCAALIAWVSVAILGHAAWRKPRIGALTERTIIGAGVAFVVTLKALTTLDADYGLPFLNPFVNDLLLRLAQTLLGLLPVYWLVLYLRGRLGE